MFELFSNALLGAVPQAEFSYSQLVILLAVLVGAVGVYLAVPKKGGITIPAMGGLVGVGALIGLWFYLSLLDWEVVGLGLDAFNFYYIFSFIAIASAVRVITHTRPVYSALWFVMVVLASAGLFLTLEADFVAFGMVIIYGGAILVTYMFVIMLASQSQAATSGDPAESVGEAAQRGPEYDRVAFEPLLGVGAGFLLLAVVLMQVFAVDQYAANPEAASYSDEVLIEKVIPDRTQTQLAEMYLDEGVDVTGSLAMRDTLTNSEKVGLDLFMSHPLGIEIAGLILLVSLIGAVMIAKKRVYEEDDVIFQQELEARELNQSRQSVDL